MYAEIKDYPNYIAYDKGLIYSIRKKWFLKPRLDKNGYYKVILYNNEGGKEFGVHRLIAEAFIPNPNNLEIVNHKDENKQNNVISNLEWCTIKQNNNYGNRNYKIAKNRLNKGGKPVIMFYGLQETYFPCLREAARITGFSRSSITKAIKSNKIFKNYYWKFK